MEAELQRDDNLWQRIWTFDRSVKKMIGQNAKKSHDGQSGSFCLNHVSSCSCHWHTSTLVIKKMTSGTKMTGRNAKEYQVT